MKIDRLIAITMYLLNRDTVSAAALAKRFEVSKRTIQRDIDTLNMAGIPIVSSHGAGGGYAILDGFRLAKQIADDTDYRNIIIALKGLSSAYSNPATTATLEKMLTITADDNPNIIVNLDAAREGRNIDEYLSVIEKAIADQTPLFIEYADATDMVSSRIVEPLRLSYQWYAWYFFAYCTVKQDCRTFKLTRVVSCHKARGTFSRPHENIDELIKQKNSVDTRKHYNIRLQCKKESRHSVFEYLGTNIIDELDTGDFILQLDHVPVERMWLSILLGFGSQVKVLEPEEVKDMLKEKAEQILSLY